MASFFLSTPMHWVNPGDEPRASLKAAGVGLKLDLMDK